MSESMLEKMKNLREYVVEVKLPEGKSLGGFMPFDRTVDNIGRFKIYATSQEEAKKILDCLKFIAGELVYIRAEIDKANRPWWRKIFG